MEGAAAAGDNDDGDADEADVVVTPADVDGALAAALATADALPDASLPDLDALTAANLRLREAVADFAGAPAISTAADQIVRALLERIEAREIALRLSPWAR